MSRKYFGTDGVRGCVGEAPITPDFCLRLGYAAGKTLVAREHLRPGDRPAVIIGKDTRIPGYMLESALEAGFAAAGDIPAGDASAASPATSAPANPSVPSIFPQGYDRDPER